MQISPRARRGFTLIELMIVVAIIGILSSIAVPSFLVFQCKAKQSEARTLLKAISTVQLAYNGEFGTYLTLANLTSFGGLDPNSVAKTKYYDTTISSVSTTTWQAQAQDSRTAVSSRSGTDTWQITQADRSPIQFSNRCR